MRYSEAKKVLEQQEAAKAVLAKYQELATAHRSYGFDSRRGFIKALQEIEKSGKGKAPGKARGKAKKGGPRGLPSEVIDQIQKLKSEGKSNAEIARTAGVSPLTVAKYVKKQAGKTAPAKVKPAKAKPAKAKPAKAKGPAKRKAAKGRGKARKGSSRGLPPKTVNQIQKLKSEGKSNAEIARTAGVSPLTVAKYVKQQPAETAS